MAGLATQVSARVKTWLADTLFKRLFALMWLALVVSHAVAFLVVTRNGPSNGGHLPTFPSLPPVSFSQPSDPHAPPSDRPGGPQDRGGFGGPPPRPGQDDDMRSPPPQAPGAMGNPAAGGPRS
jgi:protein-histidine pros-kinase